MRGDRNRGCADRALRYGDEAAFESLFLRHYGQVFRVLHNLVGSREEAEDLVQETFLALYHQPPAGAARR